MNEHTTDTQLALLEQAVTILSREHGTFREQICSDMLQLREQTHEWMQQMVNRLPNWAVIVGGFMCTSIGAMAMWIITHH